MNTQLDTMRSLLQTLVDLTKALCVSVESEDFVSATKQLDERETLLAQQAMLVAEYCAVKRRSVEELRPLFELLKQVDQDLIKLFSRKKNELAGKIELAQNQRRLLAYSR